jgi:tRNA(adenine34) deaminase
VTSFEFANDPERWMRQALREAEQAAEEDEVPIGCVIVHEGVIVGRGHNRVESLQDPTAHAEMIALTAATSTLQSWRLTGAHLYVTVEPCLMCVGAMLLARIDTVWYGPSEPKFGACGSLVHAPTLPGLNHRMRVVQGILAHEAAAMMQDFFRNRRKDASVNKVQGRDP